MAIIAEEDFEGGSDGVTITDLNTNFTNVENGGGTDPVFESTGPHLGSLCAEIVGDSYKSMRFQPSALGELYMTGYSNIVDDAGGNAYFADMRNIAGGNRIANIRRNPAGTITIRSNFTAVATSTLTIAQDEWFRWDWFVDQANGTQELRLFTGANIEGTTPDETPLTGAANTAAGAINYAGIISSVEATQVQNHDHIAIGDAWIGSLAATNNPPNQPTIVTPTESSTVSSPVSIEITYSDPDSDPQAKVAIRRQT